MQANFEKDKVMLISTIKVDMLAGENSNMRKHKQ